MAMMASTLVQEHLPQSMATSEEDAEFEEDDEMAYGHDNNADTYAASNQLQNGLITQADTEMTGEENDEEEDALSEDDLTDEDADGEVDDEAGGRGHSGDMEEEEDDEEEGVGAVKIQPRGMADDDESVASIPDDEESASDVELESEKDSDADSEVEAEWAQGEDDDVADTNRNSCVFCHMDEEHDPSEEFEESLACAVCGDNAHRQCARDSNAFKSEDDPQKWRCPGCIENELQPDAPPTEPVPLPSVRRTSAPKIARDLLPSQRGVVPNSHSVFDTLIIGDSSDGGRLLRHKRKTPSLEAEEESSRPQRKRRRDNSSKENEKSSGGGSVRSSGSRAKKSPINENTGDEIELGEPNSPRGTRSRGKNTYPGKSTATITKTKEGGLLLKVHTKPDLLRSMKVGDPQQKKKRPSRPNARSRAASSIPPPTYHAQPTAYSQPFYSFHDKENDELKSKPYGGILTEAEAETTGRVPTAKDRRAFDLAKQKAEEEWKEKTAAAAAVAAAEQPVKKAKKISGPASQIECIDFGGWEIDTWYAAPYPEEYSRNRVLFICEFCLKYMNSDYVAWRHKLKCPCKHPPGDEIYREGSIMIFEVDGRKNPVYCQNLCLLAKLFLGSKTLYYDVEPFLFYVMTEYDQMGCHFVGYFSKEKRPSSQNNVSCILTLPIHQRKGYGNLLIDFSYLLTRVEKKSGSPEKPLSDMGLVSYRNYWRLVLCYLFRDQKQQSCSIMDISRKTGMTADDIVSALEGLRALVRDPLTGTYALRLDFKYFDEYIAKWEAKGYVKLNSKALVWAPYVMGRNNALTYELPPPISTVAPREEEDEEEAVAVAVTAEVVAGMGKIHINGNLQSQLTANGNSINGVENPESTQAQSTAGVDADGDTNLIESPKSPRSSRSVKSEKGKEKEKAVDLDTKSQPQITETPTSPPSKGNLPRLDTKVNGVSTTTTTTSTPAGSDKPFIPPTRFVIFPPVPGTRVRPGTSARSASRRSALTSTPTTVSRPPPRRRPLTGSAGGASTRRTQRNGAVLSGLSGPTSSRRASGGTGRGPGRWPKGTKKSDFGNADSGPGLPPMQRSHLGREVEFGDDDDEEAIDDADDDEEDVQIDDDEEEEDGFESPAPSMNRRGKTIGTGRGKGKGKGKGKTILTDMSMGMGKPLNNLNMGMGKPKDKVEAVLGKGKGRWKEEVDAHGDMDLDAEGELDEIPTSHSNSNNDTSLDDVDAEGEPDPDVDINGDIDAEGEPDEDIDAEGELDLDVDVSMVDVGVGMGVRA